MTSKSDGPTEKNQYFNKSLSKKILPPGAEFKKILRHIFKDFRSFET